MSEFYLALALLVLLLGIRTGSELPVEVLSDMTKPTVTVLIEAPNGRHLPLSLVADVHQVNGPNVINRENGQRRIVIGANTGERDLESLVRNWQQAVAENVILPQGYSLRFEGEYLARQEASKRIITLFVIITGVIVVLLTG